MQLSNTTAPIAGNAAKQYHGPPTAVGFIIVNQDVVENAGAVFVAISAHNVLLQSLRSLPELLVCAALAP
jgi:hypothetical protein